MLKGTASYSPVLLFMSSVPSPTPASSGNVASPALVLFGGSGTFKRWDLVCVCVWEGDSRGRGQVIGDMPLKVTVRPYLLYFSAVISEQVLGHLLLP